MTTSLTDPIRSLDRQPPAAKRLLKTLYGHESWQKIRVTAQACIGMGLWQHYETATANLRALTQQGLLELHRFGQYEAVRDDDLRAAILEALL